MHLFEGPDLPTRIPGSLVFDERQCIPCDVQWHPSPTYEAKYGGDVCFECGGIGTMRWVGERKPRPWVELERSPSTEIA